MILITEMNQWSLISYSLKYIESKMIEFLINSVDFDWWMNEIMMDRSI